MDNPEKLATQDTQDEDNKRERIPKGQSTMDNPYIVKTEITKQHMDKKDSRIKKVVVYKPPR